MGRHEINYFFKVYRLRKVIKDKDNFLTAPKDSLSSFKFYCSVAPNIESKVT